MWVALIATCALLAAPHAALSVPAGVRPEYRMRRGGAVAPSNAPPLAAAAREVPMWRRASEAFVKLAVGTPPVLVSAQLDTASEVLAVPGAECFGQNTETSCGGYAAMPYSRNASSTAQALPLPANSVVQLRFADGGTLYGRPVRDVLRLADAAEPARPGPLLYITGENQAARLASYEVGAVLGLAPAAFRPGASAAVGEVFRGAAAAVLGSNIFSMARADGKATFGIGRSPTPDGGSAPFDPTVPGGYVVAAYAALSYRAAATARSRARYVGSTSELGRTIVDSGTTLMYLPPAPLRRVLRLVALACGPAFNAAYTAVPPSEHSGLLQPTPMGEASIPMPLVEDVAPRMPALCFGLRGADGARFAVCVPPRDLFTELPCSRQGREARGVRCAALALGDSTTLVTAAGLGPVTLLGEPLFRAVRRVTFDNDRGVVGFSDVAPVAVLDDMAAAFRASGRAAEDMAAGQGAAVQFIAGGGGVATGVFLAAGTVVIFAVAVVRGRRRLSSHH